MIKLNGNNKFENLTKEDLLDIGIRKISTISEKTIKTRIIFRYTDGNSEIIDIDNCKSTIDTINYKINDLVRKKVIYQRKEKLEKINN